MSDRSLLVMRHAKSSWKHSGLSDFERPLNKRGRQAAPVMAQVLEDRQLVPNLVISSSAERAKQTTELLISQWGDSVEFVLEQSLYLAGPRQYLQLLGEFGDDHSRLMVVGHNPGLEHLIEVLTGEDEFMPTSAVAIISFPSGWNDLKQCELLDVIRPREIN